MSPKPNVRGYVHAFVYRVVALDDATAVACGTLQRSVATAEDPACVTCPKCLEKLAREAVLRVKQLGDPE